MIFARTISLRNAFCAPLAYEKQLLMRESAKRGFRGISDLIRAQTIDKLLAF